MYNLNITLDQTFKNSEIKYSIGEIDLMFNKLSKYSQMQEPILHDGKEESFISWLQPTLQALNKEKNSLIEQTYQNKKNIIIGVIINIIIITCIFAVVNSINTIKSNYNNKLKTVEENYNSKLRIAKQNYNTELEKFKQNFKHADEIDNESIYALNEYFSVSNISLNVNTSNSVTFTAKISRVSDTYGMALTENSRYIVMTSSGKVYEYNVFGKHLL